MEYRYLGRSGTTVSELCLGAMTFGREADEPDSRRMLDAYADAGGNFIDTADVYGGGASEEITGRWLKGRDRDQWVIATKVRFPTGPGVNDVGLGRKHLIASIDASLRRLQTDYVDLYQIHGWDRATPLEETLSTLDALVTAGKVRYLGASNVTGWQLQKALDLSRALGYERFLTLQPQYNLLARATEWELVPVCLEEGVGMVPWAPLRGGWLSGRYTRELTGPPAGSRVETAEKEGWSETWDVYANEHTWGIVDALQEVAAARGKTIAQVAIRWVVQQPGVTAPIIGASRFDQLEANLGAVGWNLTDSELDRLATVSAVHGQYPYDGTMRDIITDR
ncbi:aldo/keto reductase [Cryptosporangium aurantiacum]|uniref:Predicted oxidoreductase n=1 Tax=Cryptosporangium aurantiacum TaxID=134849 RepID=A0A1M7RKV4_9ACTN|nr:aldo/keto reductase [Cryptosporangium aurantiacum]SHN46943.1 Predicted oxidoreductase [Cryptosporangium aurantiacum]